MCRNINFQEFVDKLTILKDEDISISYEGTSNLHISPISLESFDFAVYPKGTVFFYDQCRERMNFNKDDVRDIQCTDDDDSVSFAISFVDGSYIVIGLEETELCE